MQSYLNYCESISQIQELQNTVALGVSVVIAKLSQAPTQQSLTELALFSDIRGAAGQTRIVLNKLEQELRDKENLVKLRKKTVVPIYPKWR